MNKSTLKLCKRCFTMKNIKTNDLMCKRCNDEFDKETFEEHEAHCTYCQAYNEQSKSSNSSSEQSVKDNGQEKARISAHGEQLPIKDSVSPTPAQIIKTSVDIEGTLIGYMVTYNTKKHNEFAQKQWIPLEEHKKQLEANTQFLLLGKGTMTKEQLLRITNKVESDFNKRVEEFRKSINPTRVKLNNGEIIDLTELLELQINKILLRKQ